MENFKAKSQMEEKLMAFIEENGPLSGGTTVAPSASGDTSPSAKRLSRMESVSIVEIYLEAE